MMTLGGTVRVDPAQIGLSVARGALLHPLVIATALGLAAAATGLTLPAPVDSLLICWALQRRRRRCSRSASASPAGRCRPAARDADPDRIKLVVHPRIVYLLLSWVGDFDPVWVHAAVLMAALPPATGLIDSPASYKTYVERATAAVLFGTVISIATVTVVLILLVRDVLPVDPFRRLQGPGAWPCAAAGAGNRAGTGRRRASPEPAGNRKAACG